MGVPPAPAGWNFAASGNTSDSNVIDRIRNGLESLKGIADHGWSGLTVSQAPNGWVANGSGATDDPNTHSAVLSGIASVLRDPDAGTGSSEFASPFTPDTNFHIPAPGAGGPDAGAGADGVPPSPAADSGTREGTVS
jgi:hypothetical protein